MDWHKKRLIVIPTGRKPSHWLQCSIRRRFYQTNIREKLYCFRAIVAASAQKPLSWVSVKNHSHTKFSRLRAIKGKLQGTLTSSLTFVILAMIPKYRTKYICKLLLYCGFWWQNPCEQECDLYQVIRSWREGHSAGNHYNLWNWLLLCNSTVHSYFGTIPSGYTIKLSHSLLTKRGWEAWAHVSLWPVGNCAWWKH